MHGKTSANDDSPRRKISPPKPRRQAFSIRRIAIVGQIIILVIFIVLFSARARLDKVRLFPQDLPIVSAEGNAYGVVAVGGRAIGVVAVGGLAIGGLAIGGGAIGVIAIGGGAVGIVAFGGGAVGLFACGGGAVGMIALGGGAAGFVAIADGAAGYYVLARNRGRGCHVIDNANQDPIAIQFFETWLPSYALRTAGTTNPGMLDHPFASNSARN